MESDETELVICWQNHNKTLLSVFDLLLSTNTFVDITLACEGRQIHAHRLVLAACSDYFQELLSENKNPHPIIYLKDVKYTQMLALLAHMYRGYFRVVKEELPDLIRIAESLRIRGIGEPVEVTETNEDETSNVDPTVVPVPSPPPPPPATENQDNPEGIPLMFYTDLLQNPDKQELLAGKITQCLDSISKDPCSSSGDEVVKTVSSLAEKDILDSFFEDFFEIEMGGFDTTELPLDTHPVSISAEGNSCATRTSTQEKEMSQSLSTPPHVATDTGTGIETNTGTVNEHKITDVVEPSLVVPNPDVEIESSIVSTSARTVITVIEDEFRTLAKSKPEPTPKGTKSSRKNTNVRKRQWNKTVIVSPNPLLPPDMWTLLGRRSINPKIPGEIPDPAAHDKPLGNSTPNDQFSLENHASTPSPAHLSISSCPTSTHEPEPEPEPPVSPPPEVIDLSSPSPPRIIPVVVKSVEPEPETEGGNVEIENSTTNNENECVENATPVAITTTTIKTRRRLSQAVAHTVQKLLTPIAQPIPETMPVSIGTGSMDTSWSVQKVNSVNVSMRRQKSFSTPRKRARHVRNLNFKTPPWNQRGTPCANDDKRSESLVKDFRSKKKLEWVTRCDDELDRIDESEEVTTPTVVKTVKVVASPKVMMPLLPPTPTPKVLSPRNYHAILGSPRFPTPVKKSPEHAYFLTLHRLLGSPLGPGTVPSTPGRRLFSPTAQVHTPSHVSTTWGTYPHSLCHFGRPNFTSCSDQLSTPVVMGVIPPPVPVSSKAECDTSDDLHTPCKLNVVQSPPKTLGWSPISIPFTISWPPMDTQLYSGLPQTGAELPVVEGPQDQDETPKPNCAIDMYQLKGSPDDTKLSPWKPSPARTLKQRLSAALKRKSTEKLTVSPESSTSSADIFAVASPKRSKKDKASEIFLRPDPPPLPRELRPRKDSKAITASEVTSSAKPEVAVSIAVKQRVPALKPRTIPFPSTGFPFDPVIDSRPKLLYRVGSRQKVLTVSRKVKLIDIPDTTSSSKEQSAHSIEELVQAPIPGSGRNSGRRIVSDDDDQIVSFKSGKMVKLGTAPLTFTFDDHLRTLLKRTSGGSAAHKPE